MSRCPYCAQLESELLEAFHELGPHVNFTLDYVGDIDADGELRSMHGGSEVVGDIAQMCAVHHAPQRFLAMIVCQNADQVSVHTNWENCSAQVGIPSGPLRSCMQSGQGAQLLADSFQRSADKNIKATPTLLIGGQPYRGRRTSDALVRAICDQYQGTRPAVCATLTELPRVKAIILTDRRCKECAVGRLDAMVRNRLANPEVRVVDYGDPEGRALFDSLHPGPLPVVLFDAGLEADAEGFKAFERNLRTQGAMRIVSVGGDWNPACHDEGGCAKRECGSDLYCRREVPKRVELFAMSLCPYAARRVQELREVIRDLDPRIVVNVQFIGTGDAANGFDSMHGADEVLEDLRQVCAVQHYRGGNKFLAYLGCRAAGPRNPDWKGCTGAKTGIDAGVLQRCAEGAEGKRLLEASFRYSKRLGIESSPTFLINDKYKGSAADGADIKKLICTHNPSIHGCGAAP